MLELSLITELSPDNPIQKIKHFDDRGGVIGRDPKADWSLFDSARIISSQHAKVVFSQGRYYLADLSANGITTDEGQRLPKGEYHLLKLGEVYHFGSYAIKVTQLNIIDEVEPFEAAGLAHILVDSPREELSPLQYLEQQQNPLPVSKSFPALGHRQADTLKAFDFMPEPFDFMSTNLNKPGTFINTFCQLFQLDPQEFSGLEDRQFQQTVERIFQAMSKKWSHTCKSNNLNI